PLLDGSEMRDAAGLIASVASGVFRRAAGRFSCFRLVFSYGGGSVAFLLGRFGRAAIERKDPYLRDGAAPQLRKFYYEIAQANHPRARDALLELIPLPNVLFGTDYPLRPASEAVDGLPNYSKCTDAQRRSTTPEHRESPRPSGT